jgi:hypothetical protein
LTRSCEDKQESFAAPERDRVAYDYVGVEDHPSILLSERNCFSNFQIGGFKEEQ